MLGLRPVGNSRAGQAIGRSHQLRYKTCLTPQTKKNGLGPP